MRDPIPGFTDATALLRAGVFALVWRGEVVFVGSARGPMLAKIAALREKSRPSWLPRIRFDQVLIREVHPDQIEGVKFALIAEFSPKYNTELPVQTSMILERRI